MAAVDYAYYSQVHGGGLSEAAFSDLANVREMQYTFSSCTGLTSLDFRGFDPSELTNLFMLFEYCSNLTMIYADSTWALPTSSLPGTNMFYNCASLAGGNGTAYASSRTEYTYMRIDAANSAGYLTAA